MQIYGLDFTSAPRPRKPITCAVCALDDGRLRLETIEAFATFAQFEAFLQRPGPWVAGFDFPFGQPRRLIESLDWPRTWARYVEHVAALGKQGFEAAIAAYRQSRPPGDKHHKRTVDGLAGAISPMMLHGVPVGKMFFQGAPRLLRAGVSILPCHPTGDSRVALEAYPALVTRKWLGRQSYKNDSRHKQTSDRQAARRRLVHAIQSEALLRQYQIALRLDQTAAQALVDDPTADRLDALLCAVQAAWAASQPGANFGLPPTCDPLEGWIVDPELIS